MKRRPNSRKAIFLWLIAMLILSGIPVSALPAKPVGSPVSHGKYESKPQKPVRGISRQRPVPSNIAGTGATFPRTMRLLVIAATAQEPAYAAVTRSLDQVGIPYTTLIATQQTLTNDFLMNPDGTQGNFQGVILTTGSLGYEVSPTAWESALDDNEWNILWTYEAKFRVRQVTLYTYPSSLPDNYGLTLLSSVDTTATPLQAKLTPDGAAMFPYLNPTASIEVRNAWAYLTQPEPNVTSLLQTEDGYTLMARKTYADGRENLALTIDHNPDLLHSILLNYGIFNWVTGSIFIGERHVYLNIQVDDLLIGDDIWDSAALSDQTGLRYRMTGEDLRKITAWKSGIPSSNSPFSGWTFDWAFNGSGAAPNEDLSLAVMANRREYGWINHTWDHLNLDTTSYAVSLEQFTQNDQYATQADLPGYTTQVLVTPDISGLANPDAMRAAENYGAHFLVCNASYASCQPSTPNAGLWSELQPSIFMIPRRATNIFYNTSTPAELVSEYNHLYRAFWGRDLSYAEILEVESNNYLQYMLQYSMYPLMFHQSNARAYDGTHSLLSDVVDRVAAKYSALMRLPVIHQSMTQTGKRMIDRMDWLNAGVIGLHYPGSKVVLSATSNTSVPVTGIADGKYEVYGEQNISTVKLNGSVPVTINLAP